MNNSNLILLEYYKKYQGGNISLPWYYYFLPWNWFKKSENTDINPQDNIDTNPNMNKKNSNYSIPSLVKLDVKLYNQSSKGGESKIIIPIIDNEYNWGNYHFKNRYRDSDNKIDFTIVKSMNKILYGAGTYTAVYKIKDNNKTINDPNVNDDIYILRLIIPEDIDRHMYDNPKIHREYELFNKYLPKIYYYGNFKTSYNTFHYTITKLYNDFPVKFYQIIIPTILSNKDKFIFFYNNLVMLNDLLKKNYTHFDYKLSNVGFEIINNEKNVILIDYDENTLQELKIDNPNFVFDTNNNVTAINNVSISSVPLWLSNNNWDFIHLLPIYKFDKFATIGLFKILNQLNIKFKIDKYNIRENEYIRNKKEYEEELINYKFDKNNYINLQELTYTDPLQLNTNRYELTPSYKFLITLFTPIIKNQEKYLL